MDMQKCRPLHQPSEARCAMCRCNVSAASHHIEAQVNNLSDLKSQTHYTHWYDS